ncbi:MAG: polysulfide reductase NrfD [Deltaproteobacteria bacterium]|jgi:molybdopterin-containing oxidoreductase family membrane subunit|nr:polysulfide reductase NrfD [Deltaproteobacteria bacterium]MDA8305479.1 polysulfide reductase NrfD [Deltaproteobacteria bacterium]
MLERALSGSAAYKRLLGGLLILMGLGLAAYITQWEHGLMITGMGRDVSWGLYIAQFTFLVGVAASAVMVVLPYYIHDVKVFGRITVLGEFLAIASVIMCIMFVLIDLGKPMRVFNVFLYPAPNSMLFWDVLVLNGYLLLNIFIGWNVLEAERKGTHYPKWVKPLIYISIPWAVSIHTVTAFLIAGLPGREFWLTAIMAARFLASAFCSGPALLILLALIVRKYTNFDPGKEAIDKLLTIVTYAMLVSVFFVILEFFTAFYSNIPGHMETFKYLFVGVDGKHALVPFMWLFVILAVAGVALLLHPNIRKDENLLVAACCCVFFSMWLDKGVGLIIGGFIPNPFGQIRQYAPTVPELMITIGVWATGFFILTVLYKIAVSVKEEVRG